MDVFQIGWAGAAAWIGIALPVAAAPAPVAYEPLPLGAVRPAGWILAQLETDATEGMARNFQRFRPQYTAGTWVRKDGNAGAAELVMANYTPENRPFAFMPGDEGYAQPADGEEEDLVDEGGPPAE